MINSRQPAQNLRTGRIQLLSGVTKASPVSDANASPEILLIEDNKDDQDLLIHQLQKSGIQDKVRCVENGNDALALVRASTRKLSKVCAIFLDLGLPGVDGLLLLEAIRSNVETALLPVFVMTGSTNPRDESEARRLGATGFIPKQLVNLPAFRSTLADMFKRPDSAPDPKRT